MAKPATVHLLQIPARPLAPFEAAAMHQRTCALQQMHTNCSIALPRAWCGVVWRGLRLCMRVAPEAAGQTVDSLIDCVSDWLAWNVMSPLAACVMSIFCTVFCS